MRRVRPAVLALAALLGAGAVQPAPTSAPTSARTSARASAHQHLVEADVLTSTPRRRATPAAPYPLARTFGLHSRPGSALTIYLDFDGYRLGSDSQWARDGMKAQTYPGWSLDRRRHQFNATERTGIQYVWQQVSEDFAPFDVDVTTQRPTGTHFGAVVAVTDSATASRSPVGCPEQDCAGLAYVGSFGVSDDDWASQPAWVFSDHYPDPSAIADVAAHELGHQFGLHHDGTIGGSEYYGGQGIWSPIMGLALRPVTQWSDGDYPGADNPQDDVAVIAASAPLVPDDVGDTPATASTQLPSARRPGVISTRDDVDVYRLGSCSKGWAVSAQPVAASPDLDLAVTAYDGLDAVLGSAAPPTRPEWGRATGMGAVLRVGRQLLPTYVAVTGVGQGDPDHGGYSDYGSLGRYTLSATCG